MLYRKKALHRIAFKSEVLDRRKKLHKGIPLVIENSIPEKVTIPGEKQVSFFKHLFYKIFPKKPIKAPAYKVDVSLKSHKRFGTEINVYDETDGGIYTYAGLDIIATSIEEAQIYVDNFGLGYMTIIGEKIASFDRWGNDVLNQDRLN